MLRGNRQSHAPAAVTSDASGGWGCRALILQFTVVHATMGGANPGLSHNCQGAGTLQQCGVVSRRAIS